MIQFIQWIAIFLSFLGIYLNIKKIKWSFIIWTIGNLIWIYINFISGLPVQSLLFIGYSVVNLYGFYKWRKNENINDMSRRK